MFRSRYIAILVLLQIIVLCPSTVLAGAAPVQSGMKKPDNHELSPFNVGQSILQSMDQAFYTIPLRRQGKYALRRYRTSGNKEFLVCILNELYIAADRLKYLSQGIKNKAYRLEIVNKHILYDSNKVRKVLRSEAIKKHPDHFFYAHLLLPELSCTHEMGLQLKVDAGLIRQTLCGFDFRPGFTNPDMIRAWAGKQSKQVYSLYRMNLGDFRFLYMEAFKKVYPENKDKLLSDQQYATKISGMANLIMAASGYFQQPVTDPSLNWVLEYFEQNIDTIINRASEGVLAEIGVSLVLTDKQVSPATNKIRLRLMKGFDAKQQKIRQTSNYTEFNSDRRRNMLSGIFLTWKDIYHPGPYLYKMKPFRGQMPSVLEREYGY